MADLHVSDLQLISPKADSKNKNKNQLTDMYNMLDMSWLTWQLNSAAVLFLCRRSMRSGWKHVLAGHYPAAVGHRQMDDDKSIQQLRLIW